MFSDIFTSIINKSDINLFTTGTVYTIDPLTVKLIPGDSAIQVKALMSVKDLTVGSRLLLLRFGRQFIAIGAVGDTGDVGAYPHYYNHLEWLDYCYYYNQKRVEGCQSGWNKNGSYSGTFSNDTTETFLGNQSVRMTVDNSGEGWMIGEKNISCDMKTSEIGQAFDDDDYVVFCFKVSNNNAFTGVQLMILANSGSTSAYYWVPSSSFTTDSNGWNTVKIKFSEFTGYSSCGWTAVNNVSFRSYFKSGYVGAYVCCQYIGVVRKHPTLTNKHSLFQYYKEDNQTWHQLDGIDEGDNLNCLEFDTAGTPALYKPKLFFLTKKAQFNYIKFSEHYRNFSAKAYLHVKNANNVGGLVWWVDGDNYIACHIGGDSLYMNVIVNGQNINGTIWKTRAIARNDLVVMYLIKQNGFIKCSVGAGIILLDDPFSVDLYGDIMLSHPLQTFDTCLLNLIIDGKTTMYQEDGYYEV